MLSLDSLECQYDAGIPVTVYNTVTFCQWVKRQTCNLTPPPITAKLPH